MMKRLSALVTALAMMLTMAAVVIFPHRAQADSAALVNIYDPAQASYGYMQTNHTAYPHKMHYSSEEFAVAAGDVLTFGPCNTAQGFHIMLWNEAGAGATITKNTSGFTEAGAFDNGQVLYTYTVPYNGTASVVNGSEYNDYFLLTKNQVFTVQDYYDYWDAQGGNLYKPLLDKTGAYLNVSTGEYAEYANHSVTHYISVQEGDVISFGPAKTGQGYHLLGFDSEKTVATGAIGSSGLAQLATFSGGEALYSYTVPAGIAYVRIVNNTALKEQFAVTRNDPMGLKRYYELNPLFQKSALFVGDSICYGAGDGSPRLGWAGRIGEAYQMTWRNNGKSATSLSTCRSHTAGRIVTQLLNEEGTEYDYVILHGGVNDAWDYCAVGTVSEGFDPAGFDTSTYAGGLEETIYTAINLFGNHAAIGYLMNFYAPNCYAAGVRDMSAYFAVGKEICEKWGIPYLDMYHNDAITAAMKPETTTYLPDGIHPNAAGYEILTPYIADFMKTLEPYSGLHMDLSLIPNVQTYDADSTPDMFKLETIADLDYVRTKGTALNNKTLYLANDIDFSGATFSGLGNGGFRLNGMGHALSNYSTGGTALFRYSYLLSCANLTLRNVSGSAPVVLAGRYGGNDITFRNMTIENSALNGWSTNDAIFASTCVVGTSAIDGMATFEGITVRNCSLNTQNAYGHSFLIGAVQRNDNASQKIFTTKIKDVLIENCTMTGSATSTTNAGLIGQIYGEGAADIENVVMRGCTMNSPYLLVGDLKATEGNSFTKATGASSLIMKNVLAYSNIYGSQNYAAYCQKLGTSSTITAENVFADAAYPLNHHNGSSATYEPCNGILTQGGMSGGVLEAAHDALGDEFFETYVTGGATYEETFYPATAPLAQDYSGNTAAISYRIASPDDLRYVQANVGSFNGKILFLANDIDFENGTFSSINGGKFGLNGMGYAIRNLQSTAYVSNVGTDRGLLMEFKGPFIKNLTLDHFTITGHSNRAALMSNYYGSGERFYTTLFLENITISNSSVTAGDSNGGISLLMSNFSKANTKAVIRHIRLVGSSINGTDSYHPGNAGLLVGVIGSAAGLSFDVSDVEIRDCAMSNLATGTTTSFTFGSITNGASVTAEDIRILNGAGAHSYYSYLICGNLTGTGTQLNLNKVLADMHDSKTAAELVRTTDPALLTAADVYTNAYYAYYNQSDGEHGQAAGIHTRYSLTEAAWRYSNASPDCAYAMQRSGALIAAGGGNEPIHQVQLTLNGSTSKIYTCADGTLFSAAPALADTRDAEIEGWRLNNDGALVELPAAYTGDCAYTASVSRANNTVVGALEGKVRMSYMLDGDWYGADRVRITKQDDSGNLVAETQMLETLPQSNGRYQIDVKCAPAQLNDDVVLELMDGETVKRTFTCSAVEYLTQLKALENEALTDLCNALMAYGAAAQVYFDYNADHLARDDYAEVLSAVDLSGPSVVTSGTKAAAGLKRATVAASVESGVSLRFYFTKADAPLDSYTFAVDGSPVSAVVTADGRYMVEIHEIAAAELDTPYTVSVNNAYTVTFSALCYGANKADSGDEALVILLKGMRLYNTTANAYFE